MEHGFTIETLTSNPMGVSGESLFSKRCASLGKLKIYTIMFFIKHGSSLLTKKITSD